MKNHYNVEWLEVKTSQSIDPQNVLLGALNAQLSEVVIVGYGPDGSEYFASNKAGGPEVLWLLRRMEHALMKTTDNLEKEVI